MVVGKTSHCWSCGAMVAPTGFGRADLCPGCSKDARVCLNCRFHDPGSYNECRESVAERIVDKEKANFFEYFKPKVSLPRTEGGSKTLKKNHGNTHQKSGNSALAAAEALFKRN